MKEIHIAPLTVEGKFHLGRVMEVVTADVYTRWQLAIQPSTANNMAFVHDSWNTYISERRSLTLEQREGLINSYKKSKERLNVLPSQDLRVENGVLTTQSEQEFRDDDPF